MTSLLGRFHDSLHYTELESNSPFFIRRYKPLVCATVTLPKEDTCKAFKILLQYVICKNAKIFDDIVHSAKLSINAPILLYSSKTESDKAYNKDTKFDNFTSSFEHLQFLRRPSIMVKTAPSNEKQPQFEVRLENYELPPTPPSPKDTRQAERFDTMRFIMPANFRRVESLPKPKDERIQLEKLEERVLAGIRFNGRVKGSSSQLYWNQRQKLEDWVDGLDRWGREVEGDVEFASYNPPWTLGKFRTNEILIPLQSRQIFF